MSFGSRLKERREQLGITQVQLAEMLGVSKGAIGNYESGLNSPKATVLYKVFEVLKCDANYLFQDEMEEMTAKRFYYEYEPMINKYDSLDRYGKRVVDSVLDVEYERCTIGSQEIIELTDEEIERLRVEKYLSGKSALLVARNNKKGE